MSTGIANSDDSGIINKKDSFEQLSNIEIREWYISEAESIYQKVDSSLPVEQQARRAFELRNEIRTKARKLMSDKRTRHLLETSKPILSFEELVKSKMKRKNMTREEAIEDILKTATKTNKEVNKELGLEDK